MYSVFRTHRSLIEGLNKYPIIYKTCFNQFNIRYHNTSMDTLVHHYKQFKKKKEVLEFKVKKEEQSSKYAFVRPFLSCSIGGFGVAVVSLPTVLGLAWPIYILGGVYGGIIIGSLNVFQRRLIGKPVDKYQIGYAIVMPILATESLIFLNYYRF